MTAIFTESRRTQQYLHDLLQANGYANQIVLINGTNTDPESRRIYEKYLERHTVRRSFRAPGPPIRKQRWLRNSAIARPF